MSSIAQISSSNDKKKVETIDHDEKRMVKEDSSDSYFEDVNVNEEALRRAFDTSSNWEDD